MLCGGIVGVWWSVAIFVLGYGACKVYTLCLNFCCDNKHGFWDFIIGFRLMIYYSTLLNVLYSQKFLIQLLGYYVYVYV